MAGNFKNLGTMEGNIGLYWKKWVEKILLVEKRLFSKILEKIVKDSGGLTDFHRSESRVNETMIYLARNCGPFTTNNNQHGNQTTNSKPLTKLANFLLIVVNLSAEGWRRE